jgi:hypothetical protein
MTWYLSLSKTENRENILGVAIYSQELVVFIHMTFITIKICINNLLYFIKL